MILGLVSLACAVWLSFIVIALLITGGPWVWLMTGLLFWWVVRRCWAWLNRPICRPSPETLLPPRR